jgi:hypothetical protein
MNSRHSCSTALGWPLPHEGPCTCRLLTAIAVEMDTEVCSKLLAREGDITELVLLTVLFFSPIIILNGTIFFLTAVHDGVWSRLRYYVNYQHWVV